MILLIFDFSRYDFSLKILGILIILQICGLICFQKTEGIFKEVVTQGFLVLCEKSISVSIENYVFPFHSHPLFFCYCWCCSDFFKGVCVFMVYVFIIVLIEALWGVVDFFDSMAINSCNT